MEFISGISTSKRSSRGLILPLIFTPYPLGTTSIWSIRCDCFSTKIWKAWIGFLCLDPLIFQRERKKTPLRISPRQSVLALWGIMHSGDRFLHSFLIRTIRPSCVQSGVSCCHCRNENRLDSKLSMDMGSLQPHCECQTLRCQSWVMKTVWMAKSLLWSLIYYFV